MKHLLEATHLSKTYVTYRRGESFRAVIKSVFKREKVLIHALRDVSFHMDPGEIVGILGPNGAGKSTMIKMLTGVLYPTGGEIRVMGFDPVRQRSKYVGRIGAVFGQKSQLIFDIPPIDAFAMNKAIYDIGEADYQKRLAEMVSLLSVEEVIYRPTRVLSLGERMKCEFIMAMLHGPKIVFLDEPTIGLDIIAKESIRSFIRAQNAKGTTFVLTTHDLEDIEQLARRVLVINHGEKVYEDNLANLTRYLGNKKLLNVSTLSTLPTIDWPGVTALPSPVLNEARLLIDLDVLPMPDILNRLGSLEGVVDLNIQGVPIEEVIRRIYGDPSEPSGPDSEKK